jgi:gliding motility-associated-like protein
MFKKIVSFLSVTLVFLLSPMTSKASHLAGGEITYVCLGGNQYQINLNLYWDCTGGFDPGASQFLTLTSTCGGTASLTVTQTNPGGTDISQMCPGLTSTCSGGTFPGMNMNTYTGVVTLAPPCDTWTISYSTCCRNTSVDNVSGANYYIEATLNSATALCNSSPYFTAQPIPYVCTNQPVNYSYGVVETDGDSLYYSLVDAMDGAGVSSTYYAGYSGSAPVPGTTIDPNTGLLSFTPTIIGNYVFVILVQEYDSNGDLVGTVMRDIQFVVQNCSNTVPSPTAGTISSFGGDAVQTGPYSLEMCAGNCFNFTATYSDSDPADSLLYTSNIASALPGAVVTASGSNPLTINVSWCAPPGSMGQNLTFTMTIEDDFCPIPGQQTFAYAVNILDATTVSPDITICGSQTAQLNAYGGSVFNWSVVTGSPMTPANFSCNPCANPIASPAVTTTYAVVSNLSGTCDNVDTVTVFVVPDFTFTATQSSASSCLLEPIQLGVTGPAPAGPGYTYNWSPATYLSDPAIPNPVATITTPGSYTYTLTVTNSNGCVKTDDIIINVIPAISPVISSFADTSFCAGGTATLGVEFTGGAPLSCGLSATGTCMGTGTAVTVGTGLMTNSTTSYPAPYGNWYKSVRHQFLFTAAELTAAGLIAGKIDAIDFNITAISGTTLYKNFKIDMGCTSLTSLTTWQSGLVNVYTPKNFNIAVGWNQHVYDNAFEWDGISNVIVEICSDNTSDASYTNNSQSSYSTVGFSASIWYNTDASSACPATFVNGTSNDRPNVRFHNCSVVSDPANYTYSWSPSATVANATAQNTTGNPMSTTTYTVTVTDIAGGCSAVDSVQVDVVNINTLTVSPAGPYCVNIGTTDTMAVSVPLGTGIWTGDGITEDSIGIFDPFVAGVGTHEIIYTVTGSCGTGADTIDIVVTSTPDATITQVGNLCISGSTVFLSAVTPGGTWSGSGIIDPVTGEFDPALAGEGTDTVKYTVTSPCFAEDTMVVTVILQLDATITHVGPFCTTSPSVTLSAVDPGGTWSGPGITDPVTGVFDPAVAGPGTHTVSYTISGLCGVVDTDDIIVIPSPVLTLTSDTTEGCEPTTIQFSSTNNQPGGTSSWFFGDVTSGANDTSTLQNPSHTYNYAGFYTVIYAYSNTIGCSDTIIAVDYINIHSQPVAQFTLSPQPTTIVDPEIDFTDISSGVIDSWHWTFGYMNDTSILQNPSYIYPDSGLYPVQLIVTNIHGCADTANGFVEILPIVTFYAPNAFTPNENGNNDVFRVYGEGIEFDSFEMRIFNRWGEMIYMTKKYEEGWNGARNNTGEVVAEDVYVYKVAFKDFAGKKHQYIGHVTVVK